MSDDKFEATARQVGGKLQDLVDGATGDTRLQMDGKLDQAAGAAQRMLGDAKQTVASAVGEVKATVGSVADIAQRASGTLRDNPLAVTIAAGLVGVAIGFLLGRPSDERTIQIGRARLSYRDR